MKTVTHLFCSKQLLNLYAEFLSVQFTEQIFCYISEYNSAVSSLIKYVRSWYGLWQAVFTRVPRSLEFETICASFQVRVSRVCCRFPEEAAATSLEWQLVSGCWHLLIEFGLLHSRVVRNASYHSSDEIPDRLSDNLMQWRSFTVQTLTVIQPSAMVVKARRMRFSGHVEHKRNSQR